MSARPARIGSPWGRNEDEERPSLHNPLNTLRFYTPGYILTVFVAVPMYAIDPWFA